MHVPDAAPGLSGCPGAFSSGAAYEKDDLVSVAMGSALTGEDYSMVYQCANNENHHFCGQIGFEPGTGLFWSSAWTALGSCTGTMSPTSSPSFDALPSLGGCPGAWTAGAYEAGDRVASGPLVFACKAYPNGAHCGQAGYEPDPEGASGAWEDAWSVVGHCSGTIAPTVSPSYDPDNLIDGEACPELWEEGGNDKYEEGDLVSEIVSEEPEMRAAFVCRAWPKRYVC